MKQSIQPDRVVSVETVIAVVYQILVTSVGP